MKPQGDPSVLVLKGGPDAEREVSLKSGAMVADALRRADLSVEEVTIDRPGLEQIRALRGEVIFPVLHGPFGEGGPLQELLEADGRPFVGCRSRAARLSMDKLATKLLARRLGIPTPPSRELRPGDACDLEPPLVIKPVDDGSTVDVFICRSRAEIDQALARIFSGPPASNTAASAAAVSAAAAGAGRSRRRERAMAERFIEGREITVGWVLGRTLPIIEIVPAEGFYDYDAKYLRDDTDYVLDPERAESWSGRRVPRPPLDAKAAELARRFTMELAQGLGVRHVSRVDFMVDADGPWLLEINTMPGFTDHSLVPKAAAHAGIPFPELCRSLVQAALVSHRTVDSASTTAPSI